MRRRTSHAGGEAADRRGDEQRDSTEQQKNETGSGKVRALQADSLAGLAEGAAKALPFATKNCRQRKIPVKRQPKGADQDDRWHHHQVIKQKVRLGAAGGDEGFAKSCGKQQDK